MATKKRMLVLAALLVFSGAAWLEGGNTMPRNAADDSQKILDHIRTIFQAYLDKDLATIRKTHAADWTGFMGPSTAIERGIEDYMRQAKNSLENFHGTGYELMDSEVRIYGDIGIVFYVARYDYRDNDGIEHTLPLRSVDIYRRESGGWIQAASHITPIPTGVAWGASDDEEDAGD